MILNFINKKADNCSRLFMLLNNLVHCLLIVKIFTFNVLVWFFLHYLGLAWIYLFNFSSACYPLGGSMFFGKLLPIMGIYVQECYARNMSRIRLGQPFPWANFWESLSPPFLPQGAAKNCLHAKVSWKGCVPMSWKGQTLHFGKFLLWVGNQGFKSYKYPHLRGCGSALLSSPLSPTW